MLKRCCGTGADDRTLRVMIAAVRVDVRRGEVVDAVEALEFLQKKVGTVNAEVLEKIVEEHKVSRAYVYDDTIDPQTLLRASYEILGNLGWKSIQPRIETLDWEHVRKIFPDDVDTVIAKISDKRDDGSDGELRSIAGFLLEEELGLYAPYPSKDQPERPITQKEIDDIVLDTKLDINTGNTKQKETRDQQLEILEKVNQFVWQQKPILEKVNQFVWQQKPRKGKAFFKLEPQFKEFLSGLTTTEQRQNDDYSVALTTFREKYARFVQARNDRLQQNKENFLKAKQAAGRVLTDELANRVVALVVQRIALELGGTLISSQHTDDKIVSVFARAAKEAVVVGEPRRV